jgi:hypothetical protein
MLTKKTLKPDLYSVHLKKAHTVQSNRWVELKVWSILDSYTVGLPELGHDFCFVSMGLMLDKSWGLTKWRM